MSLARGFLSGLSLPQALNVLSIYEVHKKKCNRTLICYTAFNI